MNFRATPNGRSRRAAVVVDLTALIDVVFQLLIFFVLTSSLVDQQNAEASARVEVDQAATSLTPSATPYDDITVTIDADGLTYLDGEQVVPGELGPRFCEAKNQNPETLLLLRADQRVAHGKVAQVMAVAHACQLRVHMAQKAGP